MRSSKHATTVLGTERDGFHHVDFYERAIRSQPCRFVVCPSAELQAYGQFPQSYNAGMISGDACRSYPLEELLGLPTGEHEGVARHEESGPSHSVVATVRDPERAEE